MPRARGVVALVATAALAVPMTLLLPVSPASAEDAVLLRKVDTTDMTKVQLTVLKPQSATSSTGVNVSENGKSISNPSIQTITDANIPVGVVLVIDNSKSSLTSDSLTKVKEAAKAMVSAKQPNQQFAIVATQGTGRTISTFTDRADLLISSIDQLQAANDNALWKSVETAAGLLIADGTLQSNVVIITNTPDQASSSGTYESALSQLRTANAVAFPVGIKGRNGLDEANLLRMAQETGGRYMATDNPDTTPQILTGLEQNISDQAIVTYKSLGGKKLDIVVGVGTGTASAHVRPGTVSQGASVNPVVVNNASLPFLGGMLGVIIVATVSLLGVGLLLYGLVEVVGNDRNRLTSALRPYQEGGFDPDEHKDFSKLADSEIIKKAVAATAKAAEDRGLLQVVQTRLEQADLPLRPAEALFFTGAIALVFMVIGAVFLNFIGIIGAAVVFLVLPIMFTGFLAKRRRKRFTGQLPDTLQLLAGSMRAGYSLVQGLDAVAKQCPAPMSTELQRAMSEARLGRPIEEALQDISNRMGSDDFEWAVMAIKIQREVGGNLAELLMTVSETMIGRERLRREVKGLTAEGRVSAVILTAMPFVIGLVISVMNPAYMQPMFSNPLGQLALGGAIVMIGVGYWLMMKMIEIEA